MAETKPKHSPSLREPKAKKKLGLSVPPALRLPHEDLIPNRNDHETTLSSTTSQTSMSRQTTEPVPVAPMRDFTKVANSIAREAIPAGLFTGKSKQLYDCLYVLTRGAVTPSRTVRLSRSKLMKRAGIGARVTFDANVERLMMVGLIQVRRIAGEHDGNEYTVFLPDEVTMPSPSSMPSQTSLTEYAQNLVRLDGLDSSQTRHTLSVENTGTSDSPQTSFKTRDEKLDDELSPLSDLAKIFNEANRTLTGKPLNTAERERWAELARVLVAELETAAARTTVSSVPSFLTEHLRRKFASKPATHKGEGKPKPDLVGQSLYEPPDLERRLTPDEIAEQARHISEIIEGGYAPEQAETQFSVGFHPDDWARIRVATGKWTLSEIENNEDAK